MSHPLLKSIHTSMCILWGWNDRYNRRWSNISLTMQNILWRVWNLLIEWRWWWYCRVILCAILRRDLLGLLPIYPLAEAGSSLLNRSHGHDKLVNNDYLWVHISLIYSLVWLIWCSSQLASNPIPWRRIQIGHENTPINRETLGEMLYRRTAL